MAPPPVEERSPWVIDLGARSYDVSTEALVMGIVNRTPDSFYDQGATFELEKSIRRAAQLVEDGADIIDVGGVRAGVGPEVSLDEEIDRVVPVIAAITERFDVAVSVDTWQSAVADAAFSVGAACGNDISGFADPDYLDIAAKHGASVVATHIRLRPRVDDPNPTYPNNDVIHACEEFLEERLARALAAGLRPSQVIFDAGLDLGKTTPQSLELLRASRRLVALGQPLLLSASNKGFLGELLDLEIDERRDATLGAVSFGVSMGCRVLRVHDVKGTKRVVRTLSAIFQS
ncbi:MAG TPA: dihydropteroate synthase [Acidimicrobiales bacterium]|nr:dihydropteroate synthase [Acidimicrobiales bacterium]